METIELMDAQRAYTDALNEAERKNRIIARAECRTYVPCQAIKALGPNTTEREVCNLISAIQSLIARTGWKHLDAAVSADDFLTDAHATLEDLAERGERQ